MTITNVIYHLEKLHQATNDQKYKEMATAVTQLQSSKLDRKGAIARLYMEIAHMLVDQGMDPENGYGRRTYIKNAITTTAITHIHRYAQKAANAAFDKQLAEMGPDDFNLRSIEPTEQEVSRWVEQLTAEIKEIF